MEQQEILFKSGASWDDDSFLKKSRNIRKKLDFFLKGRIVALYMPNWPLHDELEAYALNRRPSSIFLPGLQGAAWYVEGEDVYASFEGGGRILFRVVTPGVFARGIVSSVCDGKTSERSFRSLTGPLWPQIRMNRYKVQRWQ